MLCPRGGGGGYGYTLWECNKLLFMSYNNWLSYLFDGSFPLRPVSSLEAVECFQCKSL